MAELFAVCGEEPLTPDETRGFLAMRADVESFRPGSLSQADLGYCRVAVLSRHRLDFARIVTLPDPAVTIAWIGTPPSRAGLDFADVARALTSGETRPLARLEPRFAALVCEPRTRSAWLVSDRHGLCPMYVSATPERLVCASKVTPLVASGLVDDRLDASAVLDLFTFEHVLGERTLLEGVRVLPPASVLTARAPRAPSRYWVHPLRAPDGRDAPAPSPDELYEKLRAGVGSGVAGDDRAGITLSGGLDSRALLGAARDADVRPAAYTFGLDGCRDIQFAAELARTLDLPHYVVPVDGSFLPRWLEHSVYVTGGMVAAVHFHILSLADALAAHSDLVLDGLAGDALSGSHLKWRMLFATDKDAVAKKLVSQRATAFVGDEARARLFDADFLRSADHDPARAVAACFDGLGARDAWKGCHRFDLFERQRRFIQYGGQLLEPLVRVETPFYANAFFDAALCLGPAELVEQRVYLAMQRRHLGSLAKVPDALRGLPLDVPDALRFAKRVADFGARRLPESLRARLDPPSPPTTDYAGWFSGPLSEFVAERVEALSETRLFNGEFLTRAARRATPIQIGCLLAFSSFQGMMRNARRARDAAR